jgi:HlyD family secretion protein
VATTKAGIEEGKAKLLAAKCDVGEAEADLRVARAEQRKAEIVAGRTKVVSPFDGIVTQRGYNVGSFVRSGAQAGSAPLLTVVQTSMVRAVVSVPDGDVPFLDKGDPATVRMDSLGGRVYQGVVSRTAYAEDPNTRTLRVEIDLDNQDGRLHPGQYGAATIQLLSVRNVLTIPASALICPV